MEKALREIPEFDGCHYNPSRIAKGGWFTDDFNSSKFIEGAWKPRNGLARLVGLATIGEQLLGLTDLRGLTYGLKTIGIQGNGDIVEVTTPLPLWTT